MKLVNGWWSAGPEGSPDPIAEQRKHDVKIIESALPYCKKRTLALQAGARAGLWPFELGKHFDEVFAFEPEPENFEAAAKNCASLPHVVLFEAALGEHHHTGQLKISKASDGLHHLTRTVGELDTVDVQVVTIDELKLPACDAIFLDVEGVEIDVLRGARETIEKYKPCIVAEENVLCQRYGYHKGDLAAYLLNFGYSVALRYGRLQPTKKQPFPGADLVFEWKR